MRVFIAGISGGIGRRLAQQLLAAGNDVTGIVHRQSDHDELARLGIATTLADLTTASIVDLARAVRGSDAIVFTAGAGGRGGVDAISQVDGEGPAKLAAAAKLGDVRRFILLSEFPEAWRDRGMPREFEHYMVEKKGAETKLVLTDLDWVIIRPSALTNNPGHGRVDLGPAKIHTEIARDDVASAVVEVLREPGVNRIILELTDGPTLIGDAVKAMLHVQHL